MADERKIKAAKATYDVLCKKLDDMNWKYDKIEENYVIKSGVRGDDLPIEFIIAVEPDTQIVRLLSKLSFDIAEEKRIDAAIAVCAANNGLVAGNFDYDILKGEIIFRMTNDFRESLLSGEVFEFMIIVGTEIIDRYNDRFFMLSKGMLKVEEFIQLTLED